MDFLVALVGARRKHDAPYVAHAQQEEPFDWIGEIAHVAEVGKHCREIERRASDEKALRPSEAPERDAERLAHAAAAAVGADQPCAFDLSRPGSNGYGPARRRRLEHPSVNQKAN